MTSDEVGPPARATYETPEQAALAEWRSTPGARARVVAIEPFEGDEGRLWVTVALDENSGMNHQEIEIVTRTPDGRWQGGSSFGA